MFYQSQNIVSASEYDNLNKMMDELDVFYDKMTNKPNQDDDKFIYSHHSIKVGDYVAVTWTDNMWYRGLVTRVIDHQTFR